MPIHAAPYRPLPDVPKLARPRLVGAALLAIVCAALAIRFRGDVWQGARLRFAPMHEMRIGARLSQRPGPVFEYRLIDADTGETSRSLTVTGAADVRGTGEIVWVRCSDSSTMCFAPDQLPAAARFAEAFIGWWIFVSGLALLAAATCARRVVPWLRARNVAGRLPRAASC